MCLTEILNPYPADCITFPPDTEDNNNLNDGYVETIEVSLIEALIMLDNIYLNIVNKDRESNLNQRENRDK